MLLKPLVSPPGCPLALVATLLGRRCHWHVTKGYGPVTIHELAPATGIEPAQVGLKGHSHPIGVRRDERAEARRYFRGGLTGSPNKPSLYLNGPLIHQTGRSVLALPPPSRSRNLRNCVLLANAATGMFRRRFARSRLSLLMPYHPLSGWVRAGHDYRLHSDLRGRVGKDDRLIVMLVHGNHPLSGGAELWARTTNPLFVGQVLYPLS